MPTVEFPPGTPLTLQVTAVLLVPVTVAVNCCVAPAWTEAEPGETVIATEGAGGEVLPPQVDIKAASTGKAMPVASSRKIR